MIDYGNIAPFYALILMKFEKIFEGKNFLNYIIIYLSLDIIYYLCEDKRRI